MVLNISCTFVHHRAIFAALRLRYEFLVFEASNTPASESDLPGSVQAASEQELVFEKIEFSIAQHS